MGDKLHGGSRAPMARGARTAFVALSGIAVIGSLAGCSVSPSMSAAAAKQLSDWQASSPKPTHHASSGHSSNTPTADPAVPTDAATSDPASASTPKPTVKSTTPPKKSTPKPTPTPTKTVTPPPPPLNYTDGTYSSRGSYQSPGGHETLRVTLTLKSDVVTSLTVESVHVDSTAASYEAAFEAGVNAIVVGRDIDSLNVGAVGGSSLTSLGFNSALASIKSQAKS